MKKIILLMMLLVVFTSCKNETKQDATTNTQDASEAPASQKGQAFIVNKGWALLE